MNLQYDVLTEGKEWGMEEYFVRRLMVALENEIV